MFVVRHASDYPNSQAQPNVCLDDVGVHCSEDESGCQSSVLERFIELRATGKARCVGHNGMISNRLK